MDDGVWVSRATATVAGCVAALSAACTGPSAEPSVPGPAQSLCSPAETPLFQCVLGTKQVAVCASGEPGHSVVQYRFGSPGEIELAYPADPTSGPGTMKWASTIFSGGAGMQIHFEHEGYQYVLYSNLVRTGFDSDGNRPMDQFGLYVTQDDRLVFDEHCQTNAPQMVGGQDDWIDRTSTESSLPEGEYLYGPDAFYEHWQREVPPRD